MHTPPTLHRELPIPLPRLQAHALDDQVLEIDGDIKAIAQMADSGQWLLAIDAGFEFCIARLNPDLTLDDTFGDNGSGYFFDSFDPAGFGFNAVNQIHWVDDKILVTGAFFDFDVDRIAVARYHADGRPDAAFNGNGKHIVELPHSPRRQGKQRTGTLHSAISTPHHTQVQADGGLAFFFLEVDDRHRDGRAFLVRLDANGQLDPGFNQQGFVQVQFEGQELNPRGLVQQGADLLVYGATQPDEEGSGYGLIMRFDPLGHLDRTFNGSGYVVIGSHAARATLAQVSVDEQGAIFAAGTLSSELLITRRHPDGSPDGAFNNGAPMLVALPFELQAVKAMTVQGDAMLIAASAGAREYKGTLIRLRTNGALDERFADGAGYLMAEQESEYLALSLAPDDSIIAAGYVFNGGYYAWIRRFGRDGIAPTCGLQRAARKQRRRGGLKAATHPG
ncbi:hypothetical protein PMM47T1_02489 [Pseudomonas sp. M47T1]|uniref:hypothetical protein n=1 Tax=unclassified Pseudomonas TaxID=196821 RepID=UPI0002607A8F|nr:hypothetical protein [Pseudomonas sp. M47T1]EIK98097.1 hypothetical protein PMM47T1_02489 [Pseudomonas sp. M47T1]